MERSLQKEILKVQKPIIATNTKPQTPNPKPQTNIMFQKFNICLPAGRSSIRSKGFTE